MNTETPQLTNNNTHVTCAECNREFPNERGLHMHKVRKHSGKHWNSGKAAQTRAKKLKAIRNQKYRASRQKPAFQKLNVIASLDEGYGQSAEAIINAANVLRAVRIGMRIK